VYIVISVGTIKSLSVLSAVFHNDYLLIGGAVEPSGELSLLHRDESVRLDSQHGAHHEGPGPA